MNDGEFELLFGCDEALLAAVSLGVQGAVGSTYNFAAPLYRRMLDNLAAGNLAAARAEQAKSVEIVQAMQPFGVLAATKAAMALLGVDCGPVRPPLRNLDAGQHRALRCCLERLLDLSEETKLVDSLTPDPPQRCSR